MDFLDFYNFIDLFKVCLAINEVHIVIHSFALSLSGREIILVIQLGTV